MAPKRPQAERSWSTDSGILPTAAARKAAAQAAVPDGFESASLREFLDLDDRPAFVVSLSQDRNSPSPVFINKALRNDPSLRDVVSACLQKWNEHLDFNEWIFQPASSHSASKTQWTGKQWKRVVMDGRWAVVHCCGLAQAPVSKPSSRKSSSASKVTLKSPRTDSFSKYGAPSPLPVEPQSPLVDWTDPAMMSSTPFVQFLRDVDWASTPLGSMDSWTWQLRSWFYTIVADPFPGLLYWGPQLSLLYNQACMQIIGDHHPSALGGDPRAVFYESWPQLGPLVNEVRLTGRASEHHNLCLPLLRKGSVEETFWTFTLLPIIGEDGRVVGVHNRLLETTSLNIMARRRKTLIKLTEFGSTSNSLKGLWKQFLRALDFNAQTPFAAVYSVNVVEESGEGSMSSFSAASQFKVCELECTIGIPEKSIEALPKSFELADSDHPLCVAFRQAKRSGEPILLRKDDGSLPSCLHIQKPIRGYDDECVFAVVIPIRFALENSTVSFIIHGLNPRRPYDDDYQAYMTLLQSRMTDLAANIHIPEEDRRMQANVREETLRQTNIATRLLSRTHEAEQKQQRFMRLAENAPIGMAMYDAESGPIFFNDAYFEMTGQSKDDFGPMSWNNAIHDDDREFVQQQWKRLTEDGRPLTIQHRVKQPWISTDPYDGSEIVGEKWLLTSAFPEVSGEDSSAPAQIMSWTTDISHQKWAEKLQRQRLEDALENKRQSENFIDMTSHEMRNPLSAILQSADGINVAIAAVMEENPRGPMQKHLDTIAENSQTIVLCAQHQKRIVDDILTLSKLDSNLLLITPARADPVGILRHVLRMYEAELSSTKIDVELGIDQSYKDLEIQHVMLDPSRLLQVLINLLTNAIKFTQLLDNPSIQLSISASDTIPSKGPNGVEFFPVNSQRARSNEAKRNTSKENDDGEPIYLTFTVQDSGRGLNEEEKKQLFHRFSQANPRTHVKYGGSGLGLFISRELTELQGGQIGVASELGAGSTFAFYIRATRCKTSAPASVDTISLPFTTLPVRPAPGRGSEGGRTKSAPAGAPMRPSLLRRHSRAKEGAGISVLVVEDNVINQSVMAKQLTGLGCTVHVANHGGEALEFLERSRCVVFDRSDSGCDVSGPDDDEEPSSAGGAAAGGSSAGSATGVRREADAAAAADARPALDIVLMDLEMPVMDGLTCVRRIRALQRQRRILKYIPVICTTANAREAQMEDAKSAGCDLVVTKPFRIPELLPQMKMLIDAQQQQQDG